MQMTHKIYNLFTGTCGAESYIALVWETTLFTHFLNKNVHCNTMAKYKSQFLSLKLLFVKFLNKSVKQWLVMQYLFKRSFAMFTVLATPLFMQKKQFTSKSTNIAMEYITLTLLQVLALPLFLTFLPIMFVCFLFTHRCQCHGILNDCHTSKRFC